MDGEEKAGSHERLTIVITLRSSVQIRAGIEGATVRQERSGKLLEIDLQYDSDPLGTSIGYLDMGEVASVHYERSARE